MEIIEPTVEAYQLAYRPYQVHVYRDDFEDGEPCWIAYHPEFEGLICQGTTQQEAMDNLDSVLPEWIQILLDDDLPIPAPDCSARLVVIQGATLCP